MPKIFSVTSSFMSNCLKNLVKRNKNFKMKLAMKLSTIKKTLRTERDSLGKVLKVSSIYLAFITHTITLNQTSWKNLVNFTFFFQNVNINCLISDDYWEALTNESSFSICKFSVMRNQNKNLSSSQCDVRAVSEVWREN